MRLYQGSYDKETVYFEDPVKMAKLWRVQNCRVLHLVDLDAARSGVGETPHNREVIRKVCTCLDIPVQVGGGIRTLEDITEVLDMGAYRVIIGTAAVKNPELIEEAIALHGAHAICVGIDAKDGEVRIDGWLEGSGQDAVELAVQMEAKGCRRIIYTDISRDGTLAGPNLEAYRTLGRHLSKAKITASGGVGNYQDLINVATLKDSGVDSVIAGRALYENKFPCQKIWCWNAKDDVDLDTFSTAPLKSPKGEA